MHPIGSIRSLLRKTHSSNQYAHATEKEPAKSKVVCMGKEEEKEKENELDGDASRVWRCFQSLEMVLEVLKSGEMVYT